MEITCASIKISPLFLLFFKAWLLSAQPYEVSEKPTTTTTESTNKKKKWKPSRYNKWCNDCNRMRDMCLSKKVSKSLHSFDDCLFTYYAQNWIEQELNSSLDQQQQQQQHTVHATILHFFRRSNCVISTSDHVVLHNFGVITSKTDIGVIAFCFFLAPFFSLVAPQKCTSISTYFM